MNENISGVTKVQNPSIFSHNPLTIYHIFILAEPQKIQFHKSLNQLFWVPFRRSTLLYDMQL